MSLSFFFGVCDNYPYLGAQSNMNSFIQMVRNSFELLPRTSLQPLAHPQNIDPSFP